MPERNHLDVIDTRAARYDRGNVRRCAFDAMKKGQIDGLIVQAEQSKRRAHHRKLLAGKIAIEPVDNAAAADSSSVQPERSID